MDGVTQVVDPSGEIRGGPCVSLVPVPGEFRTADELERMSPAEQDAVFEASIVTNLDDVPHEFLERVRSRVEDRIARSETPRTT